MLLAARGRGSRQVMLVMMMMMMMMTSMAAPVDSSTEDETSRRFSRRQRKMERRLQYQQLLDADDDVANNVTISSYFSASETGDEQPPKHRLIRGSKRAVTITKKRYLKTDWCKTEPFQQIIHANGCLRTRILNRFCYGQCNSFYIPKSQPELTNHDDDDSTSSAQFRSCAVCAPMTTDWTTVVLRCPKLLPPFRRRRVRVVRHCKCLAVRVRR